MAWRPAFRLLMPLRAPEDVAAAADTIEGLRRQPYGDWRLLLLAGNARIARAAAALARDDAHVEVLARDALDRVLGDAADNTLVALLGPGDLPGVDALIEMAVASGLDRAADFFTCDELRASPATGEREPFLKPRFSPDLLLSTNYVGRPWCARAPLLAAIGATPRGLLRDGEYDLVLRCTEAARAVRHVPQLLLQRGGRRGERGQRARGTGRRRAAPRHPGRDAAGRVAAQLSAAPHRAGTGQGLHHHPDLRRERPHRDLHRDAARQDRATASRSSASTTSRQADAHWQDWLQQQRRQGRRSTPRRLQLVALQQPRAPRRREGEFLLFLNDDIEIMQPDWLDALLEHAQRPEVGVVGPQLLYPDRQGPARRHVPDHARRRPPRLPLRRARTIPAISAWR